MKRILLLASGLIVGMIMFAQVSAYASWTAYATTRVNMRTGPGTQFPILLQVPQTGVAVVHRCLRSRWCDVSFRGVRGWVYGRYLKSGPLPRTFVQPRIYVQPVPVTPYYSYQFGFGTPLYYRRHNPWRKRYYKRRYYYRHW
ncbi:SH3 domain-containing protein [Pseudovibrio exalbescens]|uniref:SH3 domain-containing protein n=1 Tax=Pseudovibrio exalbescens TaxID=197461 RepID=UPI002365354E|nr:SH3 domain-containing protein [Pseudovibrio exalbescens]MDD7909385.1 SH3 domain-containing protein [Pseudovibrio exalbescens]